MGFPAKKSSHIFFCKNLLHCWILHKNRKKLFSLQTRWYTSPRFSNSTLYNITLWKKQWNCSQQYVSKLVLWLSNGISHWPAFTTSKERILHWIRSFQFCYYEMLRDNDAYLVEWIDRPGYDCFSFQEMEIKIYKSIYICKVESNNTALSPDPSESATDDNKLLITIHIYLTTGVILFRDRKRIYYSQGTDWSFFSTSI